MTKLFTGCAILCAAVALSGCGSVGPGNQGAFTLLQQITTDPHCAHDDDITITTTALGPLISGHAGRHCLAQAQVITEPGLPVPAPVTSGILSGTVVVPK
jgi:hypothetical protein